MNDFRVKLLVMRITIREIIRDFKKRLKFFLFPILRKIFGEQTYSYEDKTGHKFKFSGCFITYEYLKLSKEVGGSTMTLNNDILIEEEFSVGDSISW